MAARVIKMLDDSINDLEAVEEELRRVERCFTKPIKDTSLSDFQQRLFYKELASEVFSLKDKCKVVLHLIKVQEKQNEITSP
jgi:hypothetical protein